MREKIRRGEYPGPAPIGCLNDYRTKRIIVDKERAPIVRQAFQMYAMGNVMFDDVREILASHGIRSKNGKLRCHGAMSQMFNNPFYYSHFRYRGEVYEGKHEGIVSKEIFGMVQAVLKSRYRWSSRKKRRMPKAFGSRLRCAECGYGITAEIQKGHTYYRCSKKSKGRRCSQPYVREEDLDAEITKLLKPLALRGDWADETLLRVKKEQKQSAQSIAELAVEKRAEVEKVKMCLQRLLDSLLDELIDRETSTANKSKLMSQKKSLEE